MILDTCFILDVMRGDKSAIEKLNELDSANQPQLVTSLTIFELFTGISRSIRPEAELVKIDGVLTDQLRIPFDDVAAMRAGDIHGILLNSGTPIGVIDSMIAGIALSRSEKILTRNVSDFNKVNSLEIETY